MTEQADGASINERLLAAAREDNEELMKEVIAEGGFDVNYKDGLGNTALHIACSHGSTDVLGYILEEECDVDSVNRIERATPLHLVLKTFTDAKNLELRHYLAKELIEAGADPKLKDKDGDTAIDLLLPEDDEIRKLLRKAQASSAISHTDIAADEDDGEYSGSGSESD